MPARPRQNRTPDGAKRRWSADDRARRTPSAPGSDRRPSSSSGRPARSGRPDATSGDGGARQDRRTDWYPGPRTGRGGDAPQDRRPRDGQQDRSDRRDGSDRQAGGRTGGRPVRGASADRADRRPRSDRRDERPERPARGFDQAAAGERSFRQGRAPRDDRVTQQQWAPREDRAPRQDRGPRDERRPREDRGRFEDRAPREDRGRSEDRAPREDRGRSEDRARREQWTRGGNGGSAAPRTERPFREGRPEQERRPFRDDRPRQEHRPPREDRSARDSRAPRDDRDRPVRGDRPFRDERPARDDRAARYAAPEDVVLERLEAEVVTAEEVAGTSFADLGLGQRITEALAELGATEPFPIQSATVPHALAGRNVLGRGRTGSGKTIAFGAAVVERLMRNWADSGRAGTGRRFGRPPRALILAPTRELALQIDRTVQPIARSVGLFTTQIVGGVPQARQVGALGKGVDIVIGTPGRIEDLLEQRRLDLSEIEIAVLDEADHMAELGFLEPIQRLLRRVPAGGQRLMFSATLDTAVSRLVEEFLPDPAVHEVADPEGPGTADHRVLVVEPGEKLPVLTALLSSVDRTLVFARTRAFAEQLADDLDGAGVRAESLHGDLNQARRTRNLARFSEGRVAALVATDVAARGIHVDAIDLVVHADAAEDYKSYLHRSGRTGRAGASGVVVTLINPRRRRKMTELLERAGIEARFTVLQPGADPVEALAR